MPVCKSVTGIATALFMAITASVPTIAAEPAPIADYSLLLPANLPHLMQTITAHQGDLTLDQAQKEEVDRILAEVPARIRPLFQQAEALEKAIAADVLAGKAGDDLGSRLDQLQTVKRQAAQLHIACIGRVRSLLTPDQYRQVLTFAGVSDQVAVPAD
jgi:hypothetical protein